MVRQTLQKETDPSGAVGSPSDSPIVDFYRNRSIFLTGATGFLGKVLLEKLLRSCPGTKSIYVLLRPKEDQDIRQRLDELFSLSIFDKTRWERPGALTRVIPLNGDVTLPNLGLSTGDLAQLSQSVGVFFHCAATVRFDEPFKKAVDINLKGTKHALDVAKQLHNLVAMVHVSTAYAFCHKSEISEEIYPEPVAPEKIIEATEWMDDKLLNCIMEPLLAGRPSNYHFTKAMGEILVQKECGGIPTAIVRPSIVTASAFEPLSGWVENYYGPTGFILAASKGALRTMHVYPNIVVDCIPVDLVANMLIAVGWHLGTKRPNAVQVYNCTSGSLNPITWGLLERTTYELVVRHPTTDMFRYPGGSFKTSRFLNELSLKLEHHFPAQLMDLGAWLVGQKPQFVQQYKKMERALHILEFFTVHEWQFRNDNMLALLDQIKSRDKETFNFDIRTLDWNKYMEHYVLGVRRFLHKEDETTLPAARRKLARIYYLTKLANFLVVIGFFRILVSRSKLVRQAWRTVVFFGLQLPQLLSLS